MDSEYRPQRKILRLKDFDYTQNGAYFVTLCIQNRLCLLGDIHEHHLTLYAAGEMMQQWWNEISVKFSNIVLDEMIMMPNHLHGIVCMTNPQTTSLPTVIQWFKTMTTNAYIREVKQSDWQAFEGKLWQRSYHDRIIRNETELNAIRQYIVNNPIKWETDDQHA
jgi:REP element-mobilizing transposase RayT